MSAFSPDRNLWYQINKLTAGKVDNSASVIATSLYANNGTQGAAFLSTTDSKEPGQKWNFFPAGTGSYVLRSSNSGPHAYFDVEPETQVPRMVNASLMTNGSLWDIISWGDGTYYFTNHAVRVELHLVVNSKFQLEFGKGDTTVKDAQSFVFNQTVPDAINDVAYSSIDVIPAATTTSTSSTLSATQSSIVNSQSTSTTIATSQSPVLQSSQAKEGLSSGAIGGIAASISIVALITLIGSVLFFWRRRKSRRLASSERKIPPLEEKREVGGGKLVTEEAQELQAPATELQGEQQSTWELPDNMVQKQTR